MKLTEKTASETFCIQSLNNLSRPNITELATSPTCISSDCMAWRWCSEPKDADYQLGYCGLAGKPEI